MKLVVQRVRQASVRVAGELVGEVGRGLLVLVGISRADTGFDADHLAGKTARLRIFDDAEGLMNLSVADIGGSVLAVSQFTLYGDCQKGNRPSWIEAAPPEAARPLYERFVTSLGAAGIPTRTGVFQAEMQVVLENDGPVTLILESTGRTHA